MAEPASLDERLFLMMFASQKEPLNIPNRSHSFCATVRATSEGERPPTYQTLVHSWLPAELGPWIKERRPEPGHNYGLEETIRWALQTVQATVFAWNPLRVSQEFFDLAAQRVAFLKSGSLEYTLVDNPLFRPSRASNCIHAISDTLVPNYPMLLTGLRHGVRASQFTLDYFAKYGMIVGAAAASEQSELKSSLHLASFPIDYRDYEVGHGPEAILDEANPGPPDVSGADVKSTTK